MHEILEQVKTYARGIWRFRWYVHLIAWPICIGGWLFVTKMPDVYDASARVFVDTKSALRPMLQGLAFQSDVDEDVQAVTRTLLSRPNLEKIVRATDMDLGADHSGNLDAMVSRLKESITFNRGRKNNIYTIRYQDTDPVLAQRIVESLLTIFVESSLGNKRSDTSKATQFIDQQIAEYEQRLVAAEDKLTEFKRKNVGVLPGQGADHFSAMVGMKNQLVEAELRLQEVLNRRDELKRQLTGEEPTFGLVPSITRANSAGISHALDARIEALEQMIDELLLKYTERHPDVVAAKETLERLSNKREIEIDQIKAKMPKAAKISTLDVNPVYQQLKISLGQAEAEVASLKTRADSFKQRLKQLESRVNIVPKIEAEMQRLNRDYNINKSNYDALVARRESAKLAQKADQSTDNVKFKIIDPPRSTPDAVGPNRMLFNSVILIGGFAAGVAFAFFLSQIKPIFDTTKSLRSISGYPVYGAVSLIRTNRQLQMRKYELMSFLLTALVLVAIYAMIISNVISFGFV